MEFCLKRVLSFFDCFSQNGALVRYYFECIGLSTLDHMSMATLSCEKIAAIVLRCLCGDTCVAMQQILRIQ
ncbi:hypothetical protein scyTo_0004508 [Scyliorhinus torazame]|uniref:Uncharacterized protein n=1 Tax=Scyliorhinus torazame TaxID=75743 RepID=A0A401NSV0_SCYTO|nr:hypothetical protein [Scyliorhinus torazame]